jgi:hypothetical protein
VAQGNKTGASTLIADWTPAAEIINLEMSARDRAGTYKLIDELQQSAAAASRVAPALTTPGFALKLKGRYNVVTGLRDQASSAAISNASDATNVDGIVAVRFVIEQEVRLSHILATLATASAGTQNVRASIHEDTSSSGTEIPEEGDAGLIFSASNEPTVVSGTTPAIYAFDFGKSSQPRILLPGTYWFMIRRMTPFDRNVNWSAATSSGRGARRMRGAIRAAGVWNATIGTPDFRICSAYAADDTAKIQSDQPLRSLTTGARTGVIASFDKVQFIPATTGGQGGPFTPYVHRISGFGVNFCHRKGTWTSDGKTLAIDLWSRLAFAGVLDIDCEERTAILTEGTVPYPVVGALTASDIADWLTLSPGANAPTYDELNMVDEDMVITARGRKT